MADTTIYDKGQTVQTYDVIINNEKKGPFTPQELSGLVKIGMVTPDTLVLAPTMTGWEAAGSVPGLAPILAGEGPPPEPPAGPTPAVKRAQANAAAFARKHRFTDDIAAFSVPDTKEDLWEFALLAAGKIKTDDFHAEGWFAMMEQIHLKAQTTYRGDSEGLARFTPLFYAMELKKIEKEKRRVKIIFALLLIFVIIPILGGVLAWLLTQ